MLSKRSLLTTDSSSFPSQYPHVTVSRQVSRCWDRRVYSRLSSISPHIWGILGIAELSLYSCKSSVTADSVLCLRWNTQGGMASQAPLSPSEILLFSSEDTYKQLFGGAECQYYREVMNTLFLSLSPEIKHSRNIRYLAVR